MKVLIVEDEQLAQERLKILLQGYDPSIHVMACLDSVEETVQWFTTKPHPDILLLDIHLSDGDSFEIFRRIHIQIPVIFTTAYEHYALDAFQLFSIDYILKPVTAEGLAAAFNKYKSLTALCAPKDYRPLLEQVKEDTAYPYKTRFLAKVGQRLFFVSANEVAYFAADNKIVFLIDHEGNRFVINSTMEKLQASLNPKQFFRLNRKIMLNANAIEQIRPYPGNRLKLQLKGITATEDMIVSRDRVAEFKQWADN